MIKRRIAYDIAELRSCALKKLLPEADQQLEAALKQILPPIKFEDYSLIPAFLDEFCKYRGVNKSDVIGARFNTDPIMYRKEFMGVLLLCYHPEKMYELTEKSTQDGLQKAAATVLHCHQKTLSRFISDAQLWFRAYTWFRDPVQAVHVILMDKYKDCTHQVTYRKEVEFRSLNSEEIN